MTSSLRIVVTGLAATYPLGGVFWDYVQYVAGFRALGHDVLYLEDTGRWGYDPVAGTFTKDGAAGAAYLAEHLARLDPDLAGRWFFRDAAGATYGRPWADVERFCRSADLFLHVSFSCLMREPYWAARHVALVDSDPLYTQAPVPDYLAGTLSKPLRRRMDELLRHDAHFTFGENVGAPDCLVPAGLVRWMPTRQPVLLGAFRAAAVPLAARRPVFTTVASWEPRERGPKVDGVRYRGKSAEFIRFLDLPARSPLPLEVALSGEAPRERLLRHGWHLVDGYSVSRDPWAYRDYLARSAGEWSVAKNAYVASRSGWFSCRSACYLALGVPIVVQNTGFDRFIPTGEGVLTFSTPNEAAAALDAVVSSPARHARAARDLAEAHFASDRVLNRLLADAFSAPAASPVGA